MPRRINHFSWNSALHGAITLPRGKRSGEPYFTAGASLLWMSWEYRESVDSPHLGDITRDYLEGADGYAGVGLNLRLRKHLNLFWEEVDAGGVGFLSTTYSGEHNDLFQNFGYMDVERRIKPNVLKSS